MKKLMMLKGILEKWNDERGFGFIKVENEKKEVFIHISALKDMSRRPIVGDVIYFFTTIDYDGKIRAVNARIEGVQPIKQNLKLIPLELTKYPSNESQYYNKKSVTHPKINYKTSNVFRINKIILLVNIILAVFVFNRKSHYFSAFEPTIINPNETGKIESPQQFHCEGKTRCPEMTSCDEAKFYLNNCPGTQMDGDGDGIPCERQWCN